MTDLGPVLLHMLTAVAAGGAIGLERSYHGRPAGFRTHTLVCLASSLLMIVTVYQDQWFSCAVAGNVRIDPTRMAQGVMTGIGFLGAGVIVKEGLSVRGLTTAASIWITAAIGILAGVGLYAVAVFGTLLTLVILSAFRWAESRIPALTYANHSLKFRKEDRIPEAALKEMLGRHGISVSNLSYSIVDGGVNFEYLMTIRTRKIENLQALANDLANNRAVIEYRVVPTGD
jgi:putative Mg2+ transporter-C (MgtC) family protein